MKNNILTIPNIVSLSRLILAWPIAYYMYHSQYMITAILGAIAITSDFLDGYLSRQLNQISDAGKVIDPIVDCILILAIMVSLFLKARIPQWYIQLIILRYAIIVCTLSIYRYRAKKTPQSIPSGKWSMCSIATTIAISLFQDSYPGLFFLSMIMSTILMLVSLCDYLYTYRYTKT
jgi:CDP-diacylglycerol--glycerol-3-phosphate 3-phosphatidyltransferase